MINQDYVHNRELERVDRHMRELATKSEVEKVQTDLNEAKAA